MIAISPPTTELACGTRGAAAACVDVLREVVAALDPGTLLAAEAPDVWALFDQGEKLCAAAKILLARRVDESDVWKEAGMRSAAEYLALRGGTTRDVARDALRTSERLRDLPHVEDALRRGDLSAAQAHPIADAASHDPTAESALLDHAKNASLKELKDECLRRKVTADPKPEDTRDRIYKDRYLRLSTDAEGAWKLHGRGPLDHAGTFGATLNPLIDDLFRNARKAGRREERGALAYDALQEMARLAHATYYGYGPGPVGGGTDVDDSADGSASVPDLSSYPGPAHNNRDTSAANDPYPSGPMGGDGAAGDTGSGDRGAGHTEAGSKPVRQPNFRHLGLLRLDITALRRGCAEPGEICHLAGSGPITVSAAHRLLGRSTIKLVITDNGQVVNVTHIGSGASATERLGLGPPALFQPQPRPLPPTHLTLVHLDARALLSHAPHACGETCTIPGVGTVAVATAHSLLGPSLLAKVIASGAAVTGYVHMGRKATVAQRMALLWVEPECSVSGCPHSFVEIDHRADWAKTYVTRLEALDRLCTHHHRLKTYQGWALVEGTGKRPMVPPGDPRHPAASSSRRGGPAGPGRQRRSPGDSSSRASF